MRVVVVQGMEGNENRRLLRRDKAIDLRASGVKRNGASLARASLILATLASAWVLSRLELMICTDGSGRFQRLTRRE